MYLVWVNRNVVWLNAKGLYRAEKDIVFIKCKKEKNALKNNEKLNNNCRTA